MEGMIILSDIKSEYLDTEYQKKLTKYNGFFNPSGDVVIFPENDGAIYQVNNRTMNIIAEGGLPLGTTIHFFNTAPSNPTNVSFAVTTFPSGPFTLNAQGQWMECIWCETYWLIKKNF